MQWFLNQLKKIKNGGYSVQWLDEKISKYTNCLVEKEKVKVNTIIPQKRRLAMESRAKEMYIQKVLQKKKYSFQHPLVVINPYAIAPLTAIVLFNTPMKCRVRCTVCGQHGAEDIVFQFDEPTSEHRIPIVGLYPNVKNRIILELMGDVERKKQLFITTLPVKKELNNVVKNVISLKPSSVQFIYVSGGFAQESYAFDPLGNIRFYFGKKVKFYGTHMLSNGHFLFPEYSIANPTLNNPHANVFHEVDMMGRVYRTYMVEKGIHHWATEKEKGGNLLITSSTLNRTLGMENSVIELDRTTGEVVRELDLNQCFDITYRNRHDWAHINSIQYLPLEDAVILSLRNLHSIVKIHWESQKLEWILCNPKFWEQTEMKDKVLCPTGNIESWFYQQHAAEIVCQNGHKKEIMLFDNHIATRRPVDYFDETSESFVMFFIIDEKNRTVTLKKRIPTKKSNIRSNAVYMKDKNRLFGMSAALSKRTDEYHGMIEEFDFDTEELIRSYAVKPDYFTAYPVIFNHREMSKPLKLDIPYEVGKVAVLNKISRSQAKSLGWNEDADIADKSYYKTRILNHLLLIREKDNEIRKVFAVGSNHIYYMDKDQTIQYDPEKFANMRYYLAFPLDQCAPDKYVFYLKTNENLYQIKDIIEILE